MLKSDFLQALKEVKIKKSKICLLHVSLIDLGIFEDVKIDQINNFIFKSIKEHTPKNSTISVLTPYYDYASERKVFDIYKSEPSKEIGDFSKFIFNKKNSFRSHNPLFSISSVGYMAKSITQNHTATAFGKNSAWNKLFENNCDMIFIGCDLKRCTFIRFIEFKFGVPYLLNKIFKTKIKKNGKILHSSSSSTLRNLKLDIEYNTKKFQEILIKKGILRVNSNKNFDLMALDMRSAFKVGNEKLKKDLYFFLKKKPN